MTLSGMLNVYKEKGYTSHDVVAKLRGITGQKKIGHTGTLDPEAEGVLPVCLGKATRVCGLLTEKDKSYRAVLRLGVTTDTQDLTGTVLEECDPMSLTEEAIRRTIDGFTGELEQIPPMYSALKVNGKRLYELAREGKTVERKARAVTIYGIRIREIRIPEVEFDVSCSRGTYIRTLCQDIGEKLGTGGCMAALLRTRSGSFSLEESHRLEEIREAAERGKLQELLIPVDTVFSELRSVTIAPEQEKRLRNGNPLRSEVKNAGYADREQIRVYAPDGSFAAIYQYIQEKQEFRAVKMFL